MASRGSVQPTGGPGQSLQRTHDGRVRVRDARVRAAHPRLGRLLLAVSDQPASTAAFAKGAEGERRLAAYLERACGQRVLFLHNRRYGPGRRDGDLDHLAICASGVVVIDAKNHTGARVEVRRRRGPGGRILEQLVVSGWDRSELVTSSTRQQAAVRAALVADDDTTGAGAAAVLGVLCFLDAAALPGWRWRPERVQGVHLSSPRATVRLLLRPGPLSREDRRIVREHLDARLPSA